MAEIAMRLDGKMSVTLDATETDTVRLHASRNGLSVTDSFADIVKRGILSVVDEVIHEEKEARGESCAVPDMVGVTLNWASTGLYAVLNDDDLRFVEACVAMALREALTVVRYKKSQKGTHNVVEREDEGNGSSEHPFPVN